jgi:pimeloyl-ACP methyl ester carboxylesterase
MGHAHTRLAELRVPCLVSYGELEGPEVHHAADELLRVVPTAQRFVVPASGHLSNLEEPELFNRALQRFLEQVPR